MARSCAERRKRRSSLAILTAAIVVHVVWSGVSLQSDRHLSSPPPPSCGPIVPTPFAFSPVRRARRARLAIFICCGHPKLLFPHLERRKGYKRPFLPIGYMKRTEESDGGVSIGQEGSQTLLDLHNSSKVRGRGKPWSREARGRLKDMG